MQIGPTFTMDPNLYPSPPIQDPNRPPFVPPPDELPPDELPPEGPPPWPSPPALITCRLTRSESFAHSVDSSGFSCKVFFQNAEFSSGLSGVTTPGIFGSSSIDCLERSRRRLAAFCLEVEVRSARMLIFKAY